MLASRRAGPFDQITAIDDCTKVRFCGSALPSAQPETAIQPAAFIQREFVTERSVTYGALRSLKLTTGAPYTKTGATHRTDLAQIDRTKQSSLYIKRVKYCGHGSPTKRYEHNRSRAAALGGVA